MPNLSANSIVQRRSDIPTGKIDDELMALDPKAGQVYGMDPVGTAIWEAIEQPIRFDALVEKLVSEFDVGEEQCRHDTMGFLATLLEAGLIRTESA